MIRSLLKNDYTFSVFSKISVMIIGLLSTSFLTRYLGLEFKGEYAYISQAVSVAGLILNMGIYQSYTFYYKKNGNSVFNDYLAISLTQFVIYFVLSLVLSLVVRSYTWILIFIMVPFQVLRLQMDNIMLVQNIRARLKTNILSSIILLLLYIVLFFKFKSGVLPVVISIIMYELFILGNYYVHERKNIKIKQLDWTFTKEVLKFGFLPMLSALLVTLNYSVDIFFLKRIGIPSELSIYSVAAGIMNYVWLVPDAFKDIIFSRVARNDQKKSVAFSTKFSLMFLIVTTLGFVVLGKIFISIMYGSDFISAYGVTLCLFLGVYSMIFFKIFGIVLVAEGKRVPYFIMLVISVVMNIVLNWVLIPRYGMYGAAYASVGSYNLCGVLFLLYFSKSYGMSISELIIPNRSDIKMLKSLFK